MRQSKRRVGLYNFYQNDGLLFILHSSPLPSCVRPPTIFSCFISCSYSSYFFVLHCPEARVSHIHKAEKLSSHVMLWDTLTYGVILLCSACHVFWISHFFITYEKQEWKDQLVTDIGYFDLFLRQVIRKVYVRNIVQLCSFRSGTTDSSNRLQRYKWQFIFFLEKSCHVMFPAASGPDFQLWRPRRSRIVKVPIINNKFNLCQITFISFLVVTKCIDEMILEEKMS